MTAWMPVATKETLQARAAMNQHIRAFFQARNVMEVETPALSQFANTDPNIESFSIEDTTDKRYLHTSPEYPMKRLLAANVGDIYQISKVWRAGEAGSRHNPEFSLLEWYRLDFSYHDLMQEVESLLLELIPQLKGKSHKLSYRQAFLETLSIDPHCATDIELSQCMQSQGLTVEGELDYSTKLDVLMTHCIEPTFATDCLTFIYDYPSQQSALATIREDNPPVAERFEVYIGSLELGNGYQELQDAVKNQQVLQQENAQRKQNKQTIMPEDQYFIAAMQYGLPMCSGVALGLDRVLMAKLNKKNIQDVISFPWSVA